MFATVLLRTSGDGKGKCWSFWTALLRAAGFSASFFSFISFCSLCVRAVILASSPSTLFSYSCSLLSLLCSAVCNAWLWDS